MSRLLCLLTSPPFLFRLIWSRCRNPPPLRTLKQPEIATLSFISRRDLRTIGCRREMLHRFFLQLRSPSWHRKLFPLCKSFAMTNRESYPGIVRESAGRVFPMSRGMPSHRMYEPPRTSRGAYPSLVSHRSHRGAHGVRSFFSSCVPSDPRCLRCHCAELIECGVYKQTS